MSRPMACVCASVKTNAVDWVRKLYDSAGRGWAQRDFCTGAATCSYHSGLGAKHLEWDNQNIHWPTTDHDFNYRKKVYQSYLAQVQKLIKTNPFPNSSNSAGTFDRSGLLDGCASYPLLLLRLGMGFLTSPRLSLRLGLCFLASKRLSRRLRLV